MLLDVHCKQRSRELMERGEVLIANLVSKDETAINCVQDMLLAYIRLACTDGWL